MKLNIAALLVALTGSLLSFLFSFLWMEAPVYIASIVAVALLISLYLTSYALFARIFQEQLRNIYRIINTKPPAGLESDLSQVQAALNQWNNDRKVELERLRSNDIYRKEFIANITHELKTPLFSIEGYIHTLLDGALEEREVNRLFLEKAARNVERLVTLVNDLEEITQLETGGATFDPEVFDLTALVRDVVELLETKAQIRQRKISFIEESPMYVYADKEKIRQVLVNLIVNSIKYGDEKGNTEIRLSQVPDDVVVEISDDGPGIEPQHLPRLFERFYTVDRSRSREVGGTGIGLAIVKHIVEGHGKTISVSSMPGKGTHFRFSLDRR